MPRYIVKLEHEGQGHYLIWSTVVDAPVTYGMTLDELERYVEEEYGRQGLRELPGRMKRVEQRGVSSMVHGSVEELIAVNRAGPNETNLSLEEIIERYVVRRRGEG